MGGLSNKFKDNLLSYTMYLSFVAAICLLCFAIITSANILVQSTSADVNAANLTALFTAIIGASTFLITSIIAYAEERRHNREREEKFLEYKRARLKEAVKHLNVALGPGSTVDQRVQKLCELEVPNPFCWDALNPDKDLEVMRRDQKIANLLISEPFLDATALVQDVNFEDLQERLYFLPHNSSYFINLRRLQTKWSPKVINLEEWKKIIEEGRLILSRAETEV